MRPGTTSPAAIACWIGQTLCTLVGEALSVDSLVTFRPNQCQSSPDPRDRRVLAGLTEVGATQEEISGRTDCSLRLDDPTFAAPFYAYLVAQGDGRFVLTWSRP